MIRVGGAVLVSCGVVMMLEGSALIRSPRSLRGVASSQGLVVRRIRVAERWLPSLRNLRDREIATVLFVTILAAFAVPPIVFVGPIALAAEAIRRERSGNEQRQRSLIAALPETIDQLGLAVGAGLTLPAALRLVRRWLPAPTAPLVDDALARLDAGAPLTEALAHVGRSLPSTARRPITVIVAATRDGAPLGPSLARAADEARRARRREAEVRARRLPVLMLLPLVLCVLPAFVLLTLVPLVVGSLDGLSITDGFPDP